MKHYAKGEISMLREIKELEAETIQLAHSVRIARLTGGSEQGINYLCDSKKSVMKDKTSQFLYPNKS